MSTTQAIDEKELFQLYRKEEQPHIVMATDCAGGTSVRVEIAWTTPIIPSTLKVLYNVDGFVNITSKLAVDEKAMKARGTIETKGSGTVMFHAVGDFQFTKPSERRGRLMASSACYIA